MDRVVLVVHGRGRAGPVVNLVQPLDPDRVDHIMMHQRERGVAAEPGNVAFAAGKKTVKTHDLMALGNKAITQV